MSVDPAVLPGLLLLAGEFIALAAVGFIVVRVVLRQTDDRMALAQGLVVGPALWGVLVNLLMYLWPGLAGAAVGWGVTLGLAALVAWRAPDRMRAEPRVVAGFAVAVLALLWIGLAARQALTIPDAPDHLGMSGAIRAGSFPPSFFWSPGVAAPYHYGTDLLVGALTPPFGPNLAFVTELLGAYAWTSFILVVVTALLRRSSRFAVLVTVPLLLGYGVWTQSGVFANILQVPVPTGIPSAGLRASLGEIYWPSVEWPLPSPFVGVPDIWLPRHPLSYALALVVLERAADPGGRSWSASLALAGLVGFVGVMSATVAPVILAAWGVLELVQLVKPGAADAGRRIALLRSGAGMALALVLLAVGGGTLKSALANTDLTGVSIGWNGNEWRSWVQGSLESRPGGIGLLGTAGSPIIVAGMAVALAWRDRLVLALVAGVAVLMLAKMALRYDPAPWDLARFDGHARSFALLAFLLGFSVRLANLRPARLRYAAGALLVALVVWPTVSASVRNLGLAVGHGIEVANANVPPAEAAARYSHQGRYEMPFVSDRVAAYLRDHTPVETRVFSSTPGLGAVAFATGRPNASGFFGHVHMYPRLGPEYLDIARYLEPGAIRRLGVEYIHATDAWISVLAPRAQQWLADPGLFDLIVRDGTDTLYRVRPAFSALDVPPTPESFEALRQAVPASATVYLPATFATVEALQVAATLSHARLFGSVPGTRLHLLTSWPVEPLDGHAPDLVITSTSFAPWMFPPGGRQPIWWTDAIAVYAPEGAVAPIMSPPPPESEAPLVSVQLSDAFAQDQSFVFTVNWDVLDPEQWSGQDWVIVAGDDSPWAIPTAFLSGGRMPAPVRWFSGQVAPGSEIDSHTYELDVRGPTLAVRQSDGRWVAAASTEGSLDPGAWTLAIRLRHEWRPNSWRDAAFIPVVRITIAEGGEASYAVVEHPVAVRPLP